MQQFAGTHERSRTASSVDTILKREVRIADGLHELVTDDGESAYGRSATLIANEMLLYAGIACHQAVRISSVPRVLTGLRMPTSLIGKGTR